MLADKFDRLKNELDSNLLECKKINVDLQEELNKLKIEIKKLNEKNENLQNEIQEKNENLGILKEMKIRAEDNNKELIKEFLECQKQLNSKQEEIDKQITENLTLKNYISATGSYSDKSPLNIHNPSIKIISNYKESEKKKLAIKHVGRVNLYNVSKKFITKCLLKISYNVVQISLPENVTQTTDNAEGVKASTDDLPQIIIKDSENRGQLIKNDAKKVVEDILNIEDLRYGIKKLNAVVNFGKAKLHKLFKENKLNSSLSKKSSFQKDISLGNISDSESCGSFWADEKDDSLNLLQNESLNKSINYEDYCENEANDNVNGENEKLTLKHVIPKTDRKKQKNNDSDSDEITASYTYFHYKSKKIIKALLRKQASIKNKKVQARSNIIFKFISKLYQKTIGNYKDLFSDVESTFRIKKPLVSIHKNI